MKKLFAIAMVLTLCIGALSICSFAAEDTFTVYVTIDSETAPNAWAWGDYGNAFSAWPGVPMEQDGEYWKIEVPMGTTGFIANNGTAQTADIKISGTGDAYITVSADFATYEVTADGEGTVEPPVVTDPVYFVAGDEALLGVNWECAAEANKMIEGEDGLWSLTIADVAAGTYEFKVTDGTWANAWGDAESGTEFGNYILVVENAGEVVITFNPADGSIAVSVPGEEIPEEPVPGTGDMGLTAVAVALFAATAGLVVTLTKKED